MSNFFLFFLKNFRGAVIWSFGHLVKIVFANVKIRHYIKYFIFIYSEQNDKSENENDHFDLDHFDHILRLSFPDFG